MKRTLTEVDGYSDEYSCEKTKNTQPESHVSLVELFPDKKIKKIESELARPCHVEMDDCIQMFLDDVSCEFPDKLLGNSTTAPTLSTSISLPAPKIDSSTPTEKIVEKNDELITEEMITNHASRRGIQLSASQKNAVMVATSAKRNFFITGNAGTGKSVVLRTIVSLKKKQIKKRLIREFEESSDPEYMECAKDPSQREMFVNRHVRQRIAVLAPTGIAAFNVNGCTIHRWAGFEPGIETNPKMKPSLFAHILRKADGPELQRWKNVEMIILDEISMASVDLLNYMSEVAQILRGAPNVPFGGIQMGYFGDFLQLPPVNIPLKDQNGKYIKKEIMYCFSSYTWDALNLEHILLNEQFRQKDDEDFTKFLNLIRIGKIDDWVIQKLNECRDRQWDDEDGDGKDLNKLSTEKSPKIEPTVLFPTNQKVDEGNENELNKLPGERKTFIAKDAGSDQGLERLNKNCLAPYHLNLKIGAQVMLVRNIDVLNGLVNGSRGVVIGYSYSDNDNHNGKTGNDRLVEKEILPIVKFASVPTPITIHPALWEIKGPDGNVEAQRWQFPLKLAWFLTVHKSQGLTLDRVLTTLEGMFEWGQVYVALSRCKSFKSLRIVGEITRSKIKAHPLAVRFYEKMENDMSKSLEIQRINV